MAHAACHSSIPPVRAAITATALAGGLLLAASLARTADAASGPSPGQQSVPSGWRWFVPRVGPPTGFASDEPNSTGGSSSGVPVSSDSADRIGSDAAFLEAVLTSSGSSPAVRRGAADRLVQDRSPEATRALDRALRTTDREASAVVVEALDRNGSRAPDLADALVAVITDGGARERAAAVRVLTDSVEDAVARLVAVLDDGSATPKRRAAAAAGLGEMRSREAVAALVGLLAVERTEPTEIVQAACAALDRATGAGFGTDPVAWRNWWDTSRTTIGDELGADRGSGVAERALAARVDAAERATAVERRRSEALASRLVEVYGQLFLYLTLRERLERSLDLLDDELPPVRALAIDELERLLRNGERIDGQSVRSALVLLDDPVPALRIRGINFLRNVGLPELPARIIERLPQERDVDVTAAALAALADRPVAEAFAAVVPLLRDPVLGRAAAAVLNRMAAEGLLAAEWEVRVAPVVRDVVLSRPSLDAVQLLAIAGDESDVARVTALLDDADPLIRRGAAEGLRRRGVRRPLVERAKDPAIYGPLVAALAAEPRTWATLQALTGSPPPPEMAGEWNAAVSTILGELPVADLLAADRLLASLSPTDPRTRLVGLRRLATAARAGLSRSDADEALARFVDLLAARSQLDHAVRFLEGLDPVPGDPVHEALFRAAVLAADYRAAAVLEPEPGPWLTLLGGLIADPARARPVANEIALRFSGRFSSAEATAYQRLVAALPPTTGAAGTTASGSATDRRPDLQ